MNILIKKKENVKKNQNVKKMKYLMKKMETVNLIKDVYYQVYIMIIN